MRLIDQFCHAVEEWERAIGGSGHFASMAIFWTGGYKHRDPVGRVDPLSLSAEERKRLTAGDVMGHYTLDQVRDWLYELVDQVGVDEEFLVLSLNQMMDRWLDEMATGYARVAQKRRQTRERVEAMLADPDWRRRWLEQVRADRQSWESDEDQTDDDIVREFLASMYSLTSPSPQEMKRNLEWLTAWRQATESVIARDNIEAARSIDLE